MQYALAILFALCVTLASRGASAHAAPHSVIVLDLRADDVGAEIRLPITELEAALGHAPSEADAEGMVARDLHVKGGSVVVNGSAREGDEIVVRATLQGAGDNLELTDDVIGNRVQNHVAWIGIRAADGPPRFVGTTHYLHHVVTVTRESHGFGALFEMGMQHIAEGTDHLLFLLVLLLPLSRARRVLGIVTAFTLGHSLTLLLGALGWLHLPRAPVEALIAVSILVSAVHAIRPIFTGREAYVAGGFGLVHGLAFASALTEMHLHGGSLAAALLGFNLGIEAMQLLVIALTFPWLVLLARTRLGAPFRIAMASFAGVAALAWLGERALHLPNPIAPLVERAASHPVVLLGSLALLTLASRWMTQRNPPAARPPFELPVTP